MKKVLAALLSLSLLFCFAACDSSTETESSSAAASSQTTSKASVSTIFESGVDESVPLQTDNMVYLTMPKATGDFIQLWKCSSWPVTRWENHLALLKQAGYDFLILQSTFDMAESKITGLYFKSDLLSNKDICASKVTENTEMLETVFQAAKKTGMKIMLGLSSDDNWWKGGSNEIWRQKQANVCNAAAQAIYDNYYKEYKDLFYGWYWPYEMWTQRGQYETGWAEMFNLTRDYLYQLTPDLPVMVCPFMAKEEGLTAEENEAMWTRFFKVAKFHDGDIFCPQDSFGSSGQQLDFIEAQHLAMKRATASANAKVAYWLDVENFRGTGASADVKRFTKQLNICSKIGTGLVSFSYSHYYDPAEKSGKYHKDYLAYLETIKDIKVGVSK